MGPLISAETTGVHRFRVPGRVNPRQPPSRTLGPQSGRIPLLGMAESPQSATVYKDFIFSVVSRLPRALEGRLERRGTGTPLGH